MRARKIAIFLAITAVSALTLFFIVLTDSDALGAVSTTQSSPVEILFDGSGRKAKVEIWTVLGDGGSGDLRLPLVFGNAVDFTFLSDPDFPCRAETIFKHKEGS